MRCPTRGPPPRSVRATRRITSLVVVVGSRSRAITWRVPPSPHVGEGRVRAIHMFCSCSAPPHGAKSKAPAGAAAPQSRIRCRGSVSPSKARYPVFVVGLYTRAISSHHVPAPAGVAAPQSRRLFGGEDCLSEASSAALTVGTGAKAPQGPRPGAHGFGSFCRNKRISSCGAETPQAPLFPSFAKRSIDAAPQPVLKKDGRPKP